MYVEEDNVQSKQSNQKERNVEGKCNVGCYVTRK